MEDWRISASSLFNRALPYGEMRMWLLFFAALLFLHATQTHAHTRTHRRNTRHRRTADNLLLVVCPVPNLPPPPGSAYDVRNYLLSYPPRYSTDSYSEVVMAREAPPTFCQARARATATHMHTFTFTVDSFKPCLFAFWILKLHQVIHKISCTYLRTILSSKNVLITLFLY